MKNQAKIPVLHSKIFFENKCIIISKSLMKSEKPMDISVQKEGKKDFKIIVAYSMCGITGTN